MSKKVTAKSVIENGLDKGWTAERILKDVAKKIPDSKADASHIKYYVRERVRKQAMSAADAEKYGVKAAPAKKKDTPAKKSSAKKKDTPAKKSSAKKKDSSKKPPARRSKK